MLCEALWATQAAGAPHEYFNPVHMKELRSRWGSADIEAYWADLSHYRTSPNGCMAVNAHFFQMASFTAELVTSVNGLFADFHPRPFWAELAESLPLPTLVPNFKVISLQRHSFLRQAISWARAEVTGAYSAGEPVLREAVYSRKAVQRMLHAVQHDRDGWEFLFNAWGVEPLRLYYEDFVTNYDETLAQVATFLGLPPGTDFPAPLQRKQADQTTEEWIERFEAGD